MKETIIVALKLHIKNKIEMSVQNQKTILKYISEQHKEIERLNNIINELEKWLKDYIKLFDKPDMLEEQTLEDLKEVLGKLQELKGDSNE